MVDRLVDQLTTFTQGTSAQEPSLMTADQSSAMSMFTRLSWPAVRQLTTHSHCGIRALQCQRPRAYEKNWTPAKACSSNRWADPKSLPNNSYRNYSFISRGIARSWQFESDENMTHGSSGCGRSLARDRSARRLTRELLEPAAAGGGHACAPRPRTTTSSIDRRRLPPTIHPQLDTTNRFWNIPQFLPSDWDRPRLWPGRCL